MSLIARSKDYDFDFNIGQIVDLLGLKVRRETPTGADIDCPFCGHVAKMNIRLDENIFHCNYCGRGGGMLDLYRDMRSLADRKEALQEIRSFLSIGYKPSQTWEAMAVKSREAERRQASLASAETIDRTYRAMLSMLGLRSSHLQNLLERGLTVEQAEKHLFRSTPERNAGDIPAALLRRGCTLKGVPGFYTDSKGIWKLNLYPQLSGILVPVLSFDGLITGFQIRLDRPIGKSKYVWLTSANKSEGVSSGSLPHFVGDPADKVVYITEGALKADVAHELLGKTFGAVAGVSQFSSLRSLFEVLQKNGVETICEAYDSDSAFNPNVERARQELIRIAKKEYGFKVYCVTWDPAFKGIDDWALARKQQRI